MRTTRSDNYQSSAKLSPACRHIQRQLPLFLDGELSAQQVQEITQHLAVCPLCQREREQWRLSEQALATARQHIPAPGDLRPGFEARLAASPVPRRLLPRIDWRIAVPALAACGLVFGWLTAKNSAAPSINGNTTAASSPIMRPQIAQANNPVQNGVTVNKPAGSASRRFGLIGSDPNHASLFDASSAVAYNSKKRTGEGVRKRAGSQQVALLGPRRKWPESGSALKSRRLAAVSPPELYHEVTKPIGAAGLLAKEKPVRTNNLRRNNYSFGESHSEPDWRLALLKSKSSTQQDTDALAKTMNGHSASKLSDNNYSYLAYETKSKQKEEMREQSRLLSPAQDTPAEFDSFHTFALGLDNSTRRNFQDDNRGLGWGASLGENEDMYLEVEDTKRGFTSRTRFASRTQEQNGQRVLIIEAEDIGPRAGEATQSTPVSEQK